MVTDTSDAEQPVLVRPTPLCADQSLRMRAHGTHADEQASALARARAPDAVRPMSRLFALASLCSLLVGATQNLRFNGLVLLVDTSELQHSQPEMRLYLERLRSVDTCRTS